MLSIIMVELSTGDPVFLGKGSGIDEVGSDSKIGRAKTKNMIISNLLAKSILLVEPSSEAGFLISEARLAFTKLKQVFIDILIFYHFDLKYHI